jgi:hypothetical protein
MPEQKVIGDKDEKELEEFADEVKKSITSETSQPLGEEVNKIKKIDIAWNDVPYIFSLRAKMEKALELKLEHIPGKTSFLVKNGIGTHTTTEDSCDCKDWEGNGTSITPCKHMLKVKYSDEQLEKMLEKTSTSKIINTKDKAVGKVAEPSKAEAVQKVKEKAEISILDSEEELLMIPGISPALAEIGKIKIGCLGNKRTASGRLLPEKWDHFKIGTLMKDKEGRVEIDKVMTESLGDDKTEIDICLCYDKLSLNFPTFYAAFTQSKLACMGNGHVAWQRQEDGERKEITCDRKQCAWANAKKCKPYGRLSVILTNANRIGGTYVFRTTSWNSIRNIISAMAFIQNQTGGILAGLPLKLKLRAASAVPNGVGRKVTIYVANIEYAGTMEQLKGEAKEEIKRRRLLGLDMKILEQVQKRGIEEQVREEAEAEAEEISGEIYTEEEEEN